MFFKETIYNSILLILGHLFIFRSQFITFRHINCAVKILFSRPILTVYSLQKACYIIRTTTEMITVLYTENRKDTKRKNKKTNKKKKKKTS